MLPEKPITLLPMIKLQILHNLCIQSILLLGFLRLILLFSFSCHFVDLSRCMLSSARNRQYLRNRKHVPCFYRVTESRVD